MTEHIRTFVLSFRPKEGYFEAFRAKLPDINTDIRAKLRDATASVTLYLSEDKQQGYLELESAAAHPKAKMNTSLVQALVDHNLEPLMERKNVVGVLPEEAEDWFNYS